tara:strand:- start:5827 stop:6477 length:651 start_codon:yes stop_codon:yes gene_type:complete
LDEYEKAASDLIKLHEGSVPNYYSLPSRYGNSGATVGIGVDLGQHNRSRLEDLGIPGSIIDKVEPLFGVKNIDGEGAVEEAISKSQQLNPEELDLLNNAFLQENSIGLMSDLGPSLENIDPELFSKLASARYRGSLKKNHKTFGLIREGRFKEASVEFLNNQEYKNLKKSNPKDGVVRRMEELASALSSYPESQDLQIAQYKRGGKIRDAYGRSLI